MQVLLEICESPCSFVFWECMILVWIFGNLYCSYMYAHVSALHLLWYANVNKWSYGMICIYCRINSIWVGPCKYVQEFQWVHLGLCIGMGVFSYSMCLSMCVYAFIRREGYLSNGKLNAFLPLDRSLGKGESSFMGKKMSNGKWNLGLGGWTYNCYQGLVVATG